MRGVVDPVVRRFYIATFLYTLAHATGAPLIPTFLEVEYRSPILFVGVVMGLYGLMQIFLRLPMGDMADRRGRKPSLLLAYACTAISALFFIFAQNRWWTVPGVLFYGFAGGIFWVAANSYLFDRASSKGIARVTSDYSLVIGAAFLVGPPLGHLVADRFGFAAAFAIYLAASLAGLAIAFTLPEDKVAPKPKATSSPYVRAWALIKRPALAYSAFGTFLYSIQFATLSSFFQLHVLAAGLAVTVAGLLLGGRQLSALLVRVGLPKLLDRYGPVTILLVGIVTSGVSTALVPFATELWALVLVVALAGAAGGIMIPANLMLVHQGAPAEQRGLANGIYGTMLGLGSTVAPVAFGFIGDLLGLSWSFWAAGATALALALVLVRHRGAVSAHYQTA